MIKHTGKKMTHNLWH